MAKFIKITRPGMGGYIQPIESIADAVDGEFDGAYPGDAITLTLVEMSREEYDAMPEFKGW
jgi:hypothetical protein